jgi:hypothetical protein
MIKKFSLLRPILAILIIFIPLYPKFPLANVTGTYVAIRLDDIIVACSVLIWFIYQIINRFPVFKLKITTLIIAYYLAIIASFITALLVYQTDPPQILFLHLLRRFEYTSLLFIAISAIKNAKDLLFPYISLLVATVLVLVYGYGQKYLHFPIVSTMNSEFSKGQLLQMDVWSRISSTFAGHYDLAVYLSIVLVIIGGIIVIQKNIWLKLISIIIWLFSFHVLVLTASRVSTFAFYGGLCVTIILLRKYLWIIPVTLIFTFSLFNSKDLNQRLLATIPALKNQFFSEQKNITPAPISPTPIPLSTPAIIAYITPGVIPPTPIPTVFRHGPIDEYLPIDTDVGVARSGEIRFNAEWPRAITAFRKNPLTGTGLGSITLATDNDYLRSLGESGLLGFFTFAGILLFFIINTIPIIFHSKASYLDQIRLILLGSLITFLVNATLIDAFEASKTAYLFWIMMGVYYQTLFFESNNVPHK